MSLVGPRPERPEFVGLLAREIPFYRARHSVRPGLTGWAQIHQDYGSSIEDAKVKLEYDLFYVKNFSFWLDVVIMLRTVTKIRGAARALMELQRRRVLFLTQVLPYPLFGGAKIRAYYMLRHLAQTQAVTLVSFVRDDDRPEDIGHLQYYCAAVHTVPMQRSGLKNVAALLESVVGEQAIGDCAGPEAGDGGAAEAAG